MQKKDPAENSGFLKYFYRDWRPTRLGRLWTRIYAWLARKGVAPDLLISLEVKDRNTGVYCAHVLVPVLYGGHRYLVSMLGPYSSWVLDVRAAQGAALEKKGGPAQAVALTEIPAFQRAPILKAWCQVATSGRKHLPVAYDSAISEFESIASDYPVFRIDSMP